MRRPRSTPNRSSSSSTFSWRPLVKLGARGELRLKRRSFARRRHHPDPAPVHLDDPLGDGEAEARAALDLGKGTVDLVEPLEDRSLLVKRYAGRRACMLAKYTGRRAVISPRLRSHMGRIALFACCSRRSARSCGYLSSRP